MLFHHPCPKPCSLSLVPGNRTVLKLPAPIFTSMRPKSLRVNNKQCALSLGSTFKSWAHGCPRRERSAWPAWKIGMDNLSNTSVWESQHWGVMVSSSRLQRVHGYTKAYHRCSNRNNMSSSSMAHGGTSGRPKWICLKMHMPWYTRTIWKGLSHHVPLS